MLRKRVNTIEALVAIAFVAVLAALGGMAWSGTHAWRCRRGHYETYRVPGHISTTYHKFGNTMVPFETYVPEHDERAWKCDE